MSNLTVIIPCLDEERTLPDLLPLLDRTLDQVVVVDGGSRDRTVEVAGQVPGVEVLQTDCPRARQMNAGAAVAREEILFFLHADAIPPVGYGQHIREALVDPENVGGAFSLEIDSPRLVARVVSAAARLRSRLTGYPYGDQGLFVRRSVFHALGGFAPLPFMEDLDFSYRLARRGRVRLLADRIRVSSRRWQAQGYLQTTVRNTVLAACFYLGIETRSLAHWVKPERGP
ncbi:MAG: TIGR04283 family arsenosugar biosynthesis glycosyltransferase [Acidobacteriota bacterium]